MYGITISVWCFICFGQLDAEQLTDYMKRRETLFERDSQQSLGIKVVLTHREALANDILMKWKNMETDFKSSNYVNISKSYFSFRDQMRRSKVYQLIQRMPKGASLHVHSSLLFDPDDLVKSTYDDHCYACFTDSDLTFHFSNNTPNVTCPVQWTLMSKLRSNHTNVTKFDAMIKERLSLGPEDRMGLDNNTDNAWKEFKRAMHTVFTVIEYRPVREKLIYQSFQNLYDDNVMYVEIRFGSYYLYELNGTEHSDRLYILKLYDKVGKLFKETNPDFVGFKIILTLSRNVNNERLREELNFARQVKEILPDMFAGFDLVSQEDLGKPLLEFLPDLLEAKDDIDYFFHAGETNMFGAPVDENLFDAILLGAKRIGHGYALIKHPALIQAVKQNDIGVEVNVISNWILGLVQDPRNHPLATYLALGLPVVLCSDDPGVWGAKPLSDDFYVAFVAIASKHADLRLLKQVAINSIRYTALNDSGKTKLFQTFGKNWDKFINYVIASQDDYVIPPDTYTSESHRKEKLIKMTYSISGLMD